MRQVEPNNVKKNFCTSAEIIESWLTLRIRVQGQGQGEQIWEGEMWVEAGEACLFFFFIIIYLKVQRAYPGSYLQLATNLMIQHLGRGRFDPRLNACPLSHSTCTYRTSNTTTFKGSNCKVDWLNFKGTKPSPIRASQLKKRRADCFCLGAPAASFSLTSHADYYTRAHIPQN